MTDDEKVEEKEMYLDDIARAVYPEKRSPFTYSPKFIVEEIIGMREALGRALEQRDALVRLVEEFRRAAGALDAPDPVGVIEDLRRRVEGK